MSGHNVILVILTKKDMLAMEDISYISGHNGLITEEMLITLIPEGDTKGGVVRT
jgi:hypothetical protein